MSTETTPTAADGHFAEAQRYAALAADCEDDPAGEWRRSVHLQAAQVHATLAYTVVAREYLPVMAALVAKLEPGSSDEEGGGYDRDFTGPAL